MSKIYFFLEMLRKDLAIEVKDELSLLEVNLSMLGYVAEQVFYDNHVDYKIYGKGNFTWSIMFTFYLSGISNLFLRKVVGEYCDKESFRSEVSEDWISTINIANRYLLEEGI